MKETFSVKSNLRYYFRFVAAVRRQLLDILPGLDTEDYRWFQLWWNGSQHLHRRDACTLVSKLCFSLLASFLFVDMLGRRRSLFIGATIQMITDIYVGVYIKVSQNSPVAVSSEASQAAVAMIFIHAFGWAIGLLVLPYVFGAELWPNKIRSFGNTLSQTFSWIFHYDMSYATPSLLANTDKWGASVFFAAWCAVALLYVYLLVPETAGLSLEEVEDLFTGNWLQTRRKRAVKGVEVEEAVQDD